MLAGVVLACPAAAAALAGCGPDLDDSHLGGPPVEPVASIASSTGPLQLGAPPEALPDADEALAAAAAAVVAVRAHGCGPTANGTGFAVAPGLIVAAAHVIAGATSVEVEWSAQPEHERRTFGADVVGYDPARDLALLRTDAPAVPLALDRARLGATAAVLGYPEAGDLVASPARIEHFVSATGLWGDGTARSVYVLAADVYTGQSGSPLIDRAGRAVGIAFAAASGPRRIGFALSRGELLNFLVSAGVPARLDYRGQAVVSPPPPADLTQAPNGACSQR